MVSFLLHMSPACVSYVGAWGLSSGQGSHCSGLGALGAPRNYKHSWLVWLVTDSEARECLTAQPCLEDVRSNHSSVGSCLTAAERLWDLKTGELSGRSLGHEASRKDGFSRD